MQSKIHLYPVTILERHLDSFGHVNNATYLELLEEARWDLITAGGFGYDHIKKAKKGPTILEINIRFRREITLRQNVVIETHLLAYNGKIGELEHKIKSESGDVLCVALFKIALFDTVERKLISPTPEWLSAVGIES